MRKKNDEVDRFVSYSEDEMSSENNAKTTVKAVKRAAPPPPTFIKSNGNLKLSDKTSGTEYDKEGENFKKYHVCNSHRRASPPCRAIISENCKTTEEGKGDCMRTRDETHDANMESYCNTFSDKNNSICLKLKFSDEQLPPNFVNSHFGNNERCATFSVSPGNVSNCISSFEKNPLQKVCECNETSNETRSNETECQKISFVRNKQIKEEFRTSSYKEAISRDNRASEDKIKIYDNLGENPDIFPFSRAVFSIMKVPYGGNPNVQVEFGGKENVIKINKDGEIFQQNECFLIEKKSDNFTVVQSQGLNNSTYEVIRKKEVCSNSEDKLSTSSNRLVSINSFPGVDAFGENFLDSSNTSDCLHEGKCSPITSDLVTVQDFEISNRKDVSKHNNFCKFRASDVRHPETLKNSKTIFSPQSTLDLLNLCKSDHIKDNKMKKKCSKALLCNGREDSFCCFENRLPACKFDLNENYFSKEITPTYIEGDKHEFREVSASKDILRSENISKSFNKCEINYNELGVKIHVYDPEGTKKSESILSGLLHSQEFSGKRVNCDDQDLKISIKNIEKPADVKRAFNSKNFIELTSTIMEIEDVPQSANCEFDKTLNTVSKNSDCFPVMTVLRTNSGRRNAVVSASDPISSKDHLRGKTPLLLNDDSVKQKPSCKEINNTNFAEHVRRINVSQLLKRTKTEALIGTNDITDIDDLACHICLVENSTDINECYNLKLNAPEELIVAGFHDFCQTTLSIEDVAPESSINTNSNSTFPRKGIFPAPKIFAVDQLKTNESKNSIEQNLCRTASFSSQDSSKSAQIFKEKSSKSFAKSANIKDCDLKHISNNLLSKTREEEMMVKNKDNEKKDMAKSVSIELNPLPSFYPENNNTLQSHEGTLGCVHSDRSNFQKPSKIVPNINKQSFKIQDDKTQHDNLVSVTFEKESKPNSKLSECASLVSVNHANKCTVDVFHPPKESFYSTAQTAKKSIKFANEIYQDNEKVGVLLHNDNLSREEWLSEKPCTWPPLAISEDITSSPAAGGFLNGNCANPEDATLEKGKQVSNIFSDKSPKGRCTSECYAPGFATTNSVASVLSTNADINSGRQKYLAVVAIDLGTTYSGYAFSFTNDLQSIFVMKKQGGDNEELCGRKTLTALLLNPDCSLHSFGYSAREFYYSLDADDSKKWMYFANFKTHLQNIKDLNKDTEIAAENESLVSAMNVFVLTLKYFRDCALQELRDYLGVNILEEGIRWVITIPATWKPSAKQFMRDAAYKAGIANEATPDQLFIALELETASVYCRQMNSQHLFSKKSHATGSSINHKTNKVSKRSHYEMHDIPGTCYMIIDCGSGTIDSTIHKIVDSKGTVKELQKTSEELYGATGVDKQFEKLLCEIFGAPFIKSFKCNRPNGYMDLMDVFEVKKRNASSFRLTPFNIPLPYSFIHSFMEHAGKSVEMAVKEYGSETISWSSRGSLVLEPSAMRYLFKDTISKVTCLIDKAISSLDVKIHMLYLVGGFSESSILQEQVKAIFSSKIRVCIPDDVSMSTLKGAVLYGWDPTVINVRRLSMAYGVGVLKHFVHGVHPLEKLVVKNNVQWCADIFDKFEFPDKSVNHDDILVKSYTPAKSGQSCGVIHMYCSENDDAYFITDPGIKHCATLVLDFSKTKCFPSREIKIQMLLRDTEIKISATDTITGKSVKTEMDFLGRQKR